jgi:hypothetical protein
MMIPGKVSSWPVSAVCLLVLWAGCAPQDKGTVGIRPGPKKQGPPVTLALKFAPQDSTTYKVITERERSVILEGTLSDDTTLKGGRTGSRVEMTFAQQIQSIDERGNAVAKITIEELKYSAKVKDKAIVGFDSSREKDRRSPLAKLIGQSYTIRISPDGKVVRVIDVSGAQAAVRGGTPAHKTALALLKSDAIKERHTISGLPDAGRNQVRTGDNWSSIKNFNFDLLGSESYERIYTLKEIEDTDGRRIGLVEMNAIPSSEMAEQLHKEQTTGAFSKMFDNTKTYTGELKLNLTAGKVESCFEKMQTEWVVVDPSIKPGDDKKPAVLRMAVIRLYSLERID